MTVYKIKDILTLTHENKEGTRRERRKTCQLIEREERSWSYLLRGSYGPVVIMEGVVGVFVGDVA